MGTDEHGCLKWEGPREVKVQVRLDDVLGALLEQVELQRRLLTHLKELERTARELVKGLERQGSGVKHD